MAITHPAISRVSLALAESPLMRVEEAVRIRNISGFLGACSGRTLDPVSVGGWHGTSEAAMRLAIERGGLVGSAIAHGKAAPGHLFFFRPEPEDFVPGADLSFNSLGRGGAEGYAAISSRHMLIMDALGLDPSLEAHHAQAIELCDRLREDCGAGIQELRRLGLSKDRIAAIVSGLQEARGFLIAIGANALQQREVSDGDNPGEDYKISIDGVLPFSEIAAVVPLGPLEWAWVRRLATDAG